MSEHPDFAAFWAIFPRKDRKIEARFEFTRAAQRFGAESVILTAARYCAEVRGRPHADIMPAGIWGLDLEKLGGVLLTASLVSWQLGHSSVAGTVRDYIAPHGPYDAEHEFVYRVLLGARPRELITEDEALEWLTRVPLAPVDA